MLFWSKQWALALWAALTVGMEMPTLHASVVTHSNVAKGATLEWGPRPPKTGLAPSLRLVRCQFPVGAQPLASDDLPGVVLRFFVGIFCQASG